MRSVEVTETGLSPVTERELTDDIREVVGRDVARVPVDREHPSHSEQTRSSILVAIWSTNKFLLKDLGAVALVVAAVIGIAITHSWWMLALAFVVLAACTLWIARLVFRLVAIPERPHPTTLAALEEDGVRDPEEYFSHLVAEFEPSPDDRRDDHLSDGTNDVMASGRTAHG
jgi:hypothetical protein